MSNVYRVNTNMHISVQIMTRAYSREDVFLCYAKHRLLYRLNAQTAIQLHDAVPSFKQQR